MPEYENADTHEHQNESELLVGRLQPDRVKDPGILVGSRIKMFWPDPGILTGFGYFGRIRVFWSDLDILA